MRELVRQNLDVESGVIGTREAAKEVRYFLLSMVSILLSMVFPIVEYQLLTLSIITGLKWIVGSRKTNMLVIERRPS